MPSDDEASMTNRGHILQQLGFFQDTRRAFMFSRKN